MTTESADSTGDALDASHEFTIAITFRSDDFDAVGILRRTVQAVAEGFQGIEDVDVSGTLPEHVAWFNPTGEPGGGRFLDLRGSSASTGSDR